MEYKRSSYVGNNITFYVFYTLFTHNTENLPNLNTTVKKILLSLIFYKEAEKSEGGKRYFFSFF